MRPHSSGDSRIHTLLSEPSAHRAPYTRTGRDERVDARQMLRWDSDVQRPQIIFQLLWGARAQEGRRDGVVAADPRNGILRQRRSHRLGQREQLLYQIELVLTLGGIRMVDGRPAGGGARVGIDRAAAAI
jgi:hypothetical protein